MPDNTSLRRVIHKKTKIYWKDRTITFGCLNLPSMSVKIYGIEKLHIYPKLLNVCICTDNSHFKKQLKVTSVDMMKSKLYAAGIRILLPPPPRKTPRNIPRVIQIFDPKLTSIKGKTKNRFIQWKPKMNEVFLQCFC